MDITSGPRMPQAFVSIIDLLNLCRVMLWSFRGYSSSTFYVLRRRHMVYMCFFVILPSLYKSSLKLDQIGTVYWSLWMDWWAADHLFSPWVKSLMMSHVLRWNWPLHFLEAFCGLGHPVHNNDTSSRIITHESVYELYSTPPQKKRWSSIQPQCK